MGSQLLPPSLQVKPWITEMVPQAKGLQVTQDEVLKLNC